MGLQDTLNAFKAEFEKKVPEEALAVMHGATRDLRNSGILNGAVKVGDRLPAFNLQDEAGETVSSSALLEKGPLVISFFRGAWCPYCMLELKALSDIAADVRAEGAEIVVISPQTPDKSKAMVEKEGLQLSILSDAGTDFAKQLGVSFVLPEPLREIYGKLGGFTLPEYNGDDSWRLPMPTRLIVGQDGVVKYAEVDADYTVRPEPADTLAALRGLQKAAA
ncbi:MAG: peroxiredoxin-like family protein [Sphingomonadales bacterium]